MSATVRESLETKIDALIQTWEIVHDLLAKHGQLLLLIHEAVTAAPDGPPLTDVLAQLIAVNDRQNQRLDRIEAVLTDLPRKLAATLQN